jgi:hypothetical protein
METHSEASQRTLVTFLLDRTGSMETIKDDTIGAFNAYLDGLQKSGAPIELTLVQFDSMSIDKVYVATPVAQVPRLTAATFQPRASTPLIDAAYKTIAAVEKSATAGAGAKIVVCILTDGLENASTEYNWNDLNALIKQKAAAGWQFNFMGCGIDAYEQGQKMGIAPSSTLSYRRGDTQATQAAFEATAANTVAFAQALAPSTAFSATQRSAAKDDYAHRADAATSPAAAKTEKRKPAIVDDITL